MRRLVFVAAAFAALGTLPVAAAGCGMMQQTAGSAAESAPAPDGMMCGAAADASSQSTLIEPGQSGPEAAGGCSCCAKMASMKAPGSSGGDAMPGMEMPAER